MRDSIFYKWLMWFILGFGLFELIAGLFGVKFDED